MKKILLLFLLTLLMFPEWSDAQDTTTAIGYQGHLNDGGRPATGE